MSSNVITVIGAGNMGSSLLGGLIKNGHRAHCLWACDPNTEKLARLQQLLHIHTTTDNIEAIQNAEVVILAVKPHVFAQTALDLREEIQKRKPLVISIVAGVRTKQISSWLGDEVAIVRTMPNTPALIGCGATGLFANAFVTANQRDVAESILRSVGIAVWLEDEGMLDTVTALSGSGPAYFFLIMEVLQNAAEALGLPTPIARLLTLQTALGAARMALETDLPLSELRRQVTSSGGTTEKALLVLEEYQIREIFKQAVHAAKIRSEELAKL